MDNCAVIRDSKTSTSRIVPVDKVLYGKLQSLCPSDYVFTSYRGKRLCGQYINKDLKRRAAAIGLKKSCYCHIFRHSFITELLEQGVGIDTVATICGHADLQTTREYATYNIAHLRKAVMVHPLLKEAIDLEDISENLLDLAYKLVNRAKFSIRTFKSAGSLIIKINKAYIDK